jgi:hypothetical protein
MNSPMTNTYTIRKVGDNYGLYFNGQLVESGIFATRKTAEKHKAIAESEHNSRLASGLASGLARLGVCAECRESIYSMNHVIVAKDGALFHGRCWSNA